MKRQPFVIIPFQQLSAEALSGVLEAYVNREGTDYGHGSAPSLAQKVDQIRRQLEEGRAVVVFDPDRQSCNIVPRHVLPRKSTP
ncbi:MAG: YheU family protein [Desulfobacterales bacterium]|jgi:uncharacterized protein YheU (UPF0270 family)